MTSRRLRVLATALALLLAAAVTRAATPIFWQVSTRTDLLKGEVENLSIDAEGRLVLAPTIDLVHESTAPFIWALMPGPDGSLYAGTGNEGKVFRIDRDGKATLFYDAPELEVHALAPAPGGGLYVATSPDGKIYKVDSRGTATTFFDPEDKYIWALAVDASGNLYAGTGEKGVIYTITPDGKSKPFYETKATHVVALAFDQAGNLLAGTESPGRVFRIDRDGKPFVLLDSPFKEIHALRVDARGVIYAAAVSAKAGQEERPGEALPPGGEAGRPGPVPSVSTEITSISIVDVSVPAAPELKSARREDRRAPKGAVYRITPDGLWETVWESSEDLPYDLAFDASGRLLVGTGNKGKIFRVTGDPPQTMLLARALAQQVTRFMTDEKGQLCYATANPGKIFRLSASHAERGTYESEVRDAQTASTWGTINWRGSSAPGGIQLFTRSGNSAVPDDTWSPWNGPYTNADGQQIQSPKARYLQWRAVLTGKGESPVLTSVTAAYLQRNLRPRVTSITVYPPGTVFQKPFSTGELEIAGYDDGYGEAKLATFPASSSSATPTVSGGPPLGRRIYQKGLQTFAWKAEDDNDDKLLYDILYRREGEASWKTLKSGLSEPLLVWDTTTVPNGTYQIRVVASDAPSNPSGTALTGEDESTTFDVDNTPPTVQVQGTRRDGGRTILRFEVRDDQSAIQRVEYSIDADRWRPVFPVDGICDSRVEQFELVLEGDALPKSLVIRAVDTMNNVATARADIRPTTTQ
jgi:sugar lactone lactonase YvrE